MEFPGSAALAAALCLLTCSQASAATGSGPKSPDGFDARKLPANTWAIQPKAKVNSKHALVVRGWTSLRYDPSSKRLLWFVADETERRIYSNCLWFYNPDKSEWTSEAKPYPIPKPQGAKAMIYRDDHPMTRHPFRGNAVDPVNKVYVQYGGVGYGRWQTDTWVYDLRKGTWKDLRLTTHPRGAGNNAMVYVPELRGILAHGGHINGNSMNGTWLFDVKAGSWKDLKAANSPRASDQHMVYDARGKVAVMHLSGRLWLYSIAKNSWSELKAEGAPPPRLKPGLAWDRASGLVVLMGGYTKAENKRAYNNPKRRWNDPRNGTLADTWVLDLSEKKWVDLGKDKDLPPQLGSGTELCGDPNRGCVWGVGGRKTTVLALRLDRKALGFKPLAKAKPDKK